MNTPEPSPSVVWLSVTNGLLLVFQHIPRAVTGAPPSVVIFPPETAEFDVMEVAGVVVSEGVLALLLKVISFPYAVPAEFVA